MRTMFVTPVEIGSGETITALHMAENIAEQSDGVLFLASEFAGSFIGKRFPDRIRELSDDGDQNRLIWESSLCEFQPDAVVFADYPLLFFSSGVSPISDKDEWVSSLEGIDAQLITLDHMGFAQQAMGLFFGPPHLSFHYETLPAIPKRMHVLLPCPMHEPSLVTGRKGQPFRYWNLPLFVPEDRRQEVRRRYLDREDDYLIFHAVARWAWQTAQAYGIPYYEFLPRILEYHLADVHKPVTVISVNNGQLLEDPGGSRLRFVNLPSLPKSEYESLLFASDLMITENKISITLGKAICGFLPCVAFRNSYRYRELLDCLGGELRDLVKEIEARRLGSVYPYEVFPNGMKEELEELGLYRCNSITNGFKQLEIYEEDKTRRELCSLLQDEETRNSLRTKQYAYVKRMQSLDDAGQALRRIVEGKGEADG